LADRLDGVFYCFGYPMPPDDGYLKRICLYYDSVYVPDIEWYERAYQFYFNEEALVDWMDDLYRKYIHSTEKWVQEGIVKVLDSKQAGKRWEEACQFDWSDPKYHQAFGDAVKHGMMSYHVEMLARMDKDLMNTQLLESLRNSENAAVEGLALLTRRSTVASLNLALDFAADSTAIPTSHSEAAERLLRYKTARTLGEQTDANQVLEEVLKLTVPHFEYVPVEQVWQVRKDFRDSLSEFRKEIGRINRIVITCIDREKRDEIKQIVQNEIFPRIVELKKRELELQPKLGAKQVGEMSIKELLGQVPYVSLLLAGWEAIKTWRLQRQLQQNSFYILTLL
jgi:hypothetical protein